MPSSGPVRSKTLLSNVHEKLPVLQSLIHRSCRRPVCEIHRSQNPGTPSQQTVRLAPALFAQSPKPVHINRFVVADLLLYYLMYWGRSEEHTSELQSRPHLV